MTDYASVLENYTIPEYEIATEGMISGIIKLIVSFLTSFKGKLIAIVSAIVAVIAGAAKKKASTRNNIDPTDANSPQTSPYAGRITRGPNNMTSTTKGTRSEIREMKRKAARQKDLQRILSYILHEIDRGYNATNKSLDCLVNVHDNGLDNPNNAYTNKSKKRYNSDDTLIDCAAEIGAALSNIRDQYDYYSDYNFAEEKDKIDLDAKILKTLNDQKRKIESSIKMITNLISKYTNDKRFDQNNYLKEFIQEIPKNATELVSYIVRTISIIKLHTN